MTTILPTQTRPGAAGGTQMLYEFPNGYGASLIEGGMAAYGGRELAVLYKGQITYDTPITDDVLGYLSEDDVQPLLARIAALPAVSA